ncbi:histidine triad nucleotide-binding protein [Natranaerobius trueperi]|uniref:Histidine triad nucleotide-binding protein n=1 Tax=Natranaerobius trueperi TaxID=759412 RepID=A0A226BVP2_9FIRM|nr:histidine triad nucleotide-binding protein [Natranaerobius trueperi]OWZ83053.1 histidine triad nucleotide-binding protein [Natranaerobius trueperi]
MSDCIFCKIVNKEIDSEIVYENENILAFKDVEPQAPVHLLVIPKKHIESFMNFQEEDDELFAEIMVTLQKLAKDFELDRSGFRIVNNCGEEGGQTVNHVHFHLLGKRTLTWPPG